MTAGGVVHISPRDNVIVLGVQVFQHSLSFVIGQLRRLKLLLNFETFCLTVRNQRAEQVLRKSTFAAQGFNDLGLQHIQLGRYFCMFGPDAAEQRFPFLHLFFVSDIDDLTFGDSFHTLKDLSHHLINDAVKGMCRVPGLTVTFRLLAGFAVADIPYTLYNAVWIVLAGISLAVCGE